MRARMQCHRRQSDHARLFYDTLVQQSAARLNNLRTIAIPTTASLCFRLSKVAWIARRIRHQSRIDDLSPCTIRRMLATASLRAVFSEGRYICGHQPASWVKRLCSGNVWLAQAVKVR